MRTEDKIQHLFDECGDNSSKRPECIRKFMRNELTNAEQFEPVSFLLRYCLYPKKPNQNTAAFGRFCLIGVSLS